METPESIFFELDENEDNDVIDWIFDSKPLEDTEFVNGSSYKKYFLNLGMMKNLHRLSEQLLSENFDKNFYFLFSEKFFLNAKALNLAIPGGPKFEPLFRDTL